MQATEHITLMATYTVYNFEIKVFEDFIHSDNFDSDFFAEHNLRLGGVFLVAGEPYRIIDEFLDGDYCAKHIESYGIDEWVLSGNTDPKVKCHGTYTTHYKRDLPVHTLQRLVAIEAHKDNPLENTHQHSHT